MVSGTYVLTDTIKKGFDNDLHRLVPERRRRDHRQDARSATRTQRSRRRSPSPCSTRSRALPGVERRRAASTTTRRTSSAANGKVISTGGAPNLGFSVDPAGDQRFNPLTLVQGKWPVGADEIAIDAATADKQRTTRSATRSASSRRGPTQQFHDPGIAELGGVASIGGATLAIFDLPTAQTAVRQGRASSTQIDVAAKPGVSRQRARLARSSRPASEHAGAHRDRSRPTSRRRTRPRSLDPAEVPARLRLRRALRRRVRDREHALDHDRPAHA